MIDVSTAACSCAQPGASATASADTGRERKWVDLRVTVTKCLTTVTKHSGLWVRVIWMIIKEAAAII